MTIPLVYFQGYSDPDSFSGRIQSVHTDATVDELGYYATAYTRGSYTYHGANDWRYFIVSRDGTKVYAMRAMNNTVRSLATFDSDVVISFPWFSPYVNLPAWFEFEMAWDFSLSDFYSDLGGDPLSVARIDYNDLSSDVIQLIDVGATGAYNAWTHLNNDTEVIMGHVEEDRWHTIKFKATDSAGQCVLTVDGDSLTLASAGGSGGEKLSSVGYGNLSFSAAGITYMGRIQLGSTDGGHEHLRYTPFWDGFPWQDQDTPGITHAQYPNGNPKSFDGVNIDNPHNLDWNYPSFSPTEINPPSGWVAADEVWEMNLDGTDSSSTDTPGWPGKRKVQALQSDRFYHMRLTAQITNHGLDVVTQRYEVYDGTNLPTSIYRYDFGSASWIPINVGTDYTTVTGRYQSVYSGFSYSGDVIWVARPVSGAYQIHFHQRDGTFISTAVLTNPIQTIYVAMDPVDETKFYYFGGGTNFTNLNKGYTDGTTASIELFDTGSGHAGNIPLFTPDNKIYFNYDATVTDVYTINRDGSGLTNVTNGNLSGIGSYRQPSWSPSGDSFATVTNDHVWRYDVDTEVLTDLKPFNLLPTYYCDQPIWVGESAPPFIPPDDPATLAGKRAYYHNGAWHLLNDQT